MGLLPNHARWLSRHLGWGRTALRGGYWSTQLHSTALNICAALLLCSHVDPVLYGSECLGVGHSGRTL